MKAFADHMTEGTFKALLVHGLILILFGVILFFTTMDYLAHPAGTPAWRIYPGVAGWMLCIVAGISIVVLTMVRLNGPFDANGPTRLSRFFKILFAAEIAGAFTMSSTVAFGDDTGLRILLWILVANLLLLSFMGRRSKKATAP